MLQHPHSKKHKRQLLAQLITILILSTLASCEKVIDIQLNDTEPVLVIEGNITDMDDTHYVYISKTVPFSAPSTQSPVEGALVHIIEQRPSISILDDTMIRSDRTFTEVQPGVYELRNYRGYSGRKYTLQVSVEGQQYTASSTMPENTPIDSIGTVTDNIFGDEQKTVGVVYQDPPGVKNYYRYLVMVNGKPSNLVFAYNDKFNDGKQVQRNFYDDDLDLKTNDAVMVEQQCIDAAVYKYFNGIQSNNPGAAAPANPVSNFSNGALGYFSAHTVSRAATSIE